MWFCCDPEHQSAHLTIFLITLDNNSSQAVSVLEDKRKLMPQVRLGGGGLSGRPQMARLGGWAARAEHQPSCSGSTDRPWATLHLKSEVYSLQQVPGTEAQTGGGLCVCMV